MKTPIKIHPFDMYALLDKLVGAGPIDVIVRRMASEVEHPSPDITTICGIEFQQTTTVEPFNDMTAELTAK